MMKVTNYYRDLDKTLQYAIDEKVGRQRLIRMKDFCMQKFTYIEHKRRPN